MYLVELFQQKITEVPMTPTAFAQSQARGQRAGVQIGFEFEVCVPSIVIKAAKTLELKQEKKYTFPRDWTSFFDSFELSNFFELATPVSWNGEAYSSLNKLWRAWDRYHVNKFYNQWRPQVEKIQNPRVKQDLKELDQEPKSQRAYTFLNSLVLDRLPSNHPIARAGRQVSGTIDSAKKFLTQVFNINPRQSPLGPLKWRSANSIRDFKQYVEDYDEYDYSDDDSSLGSDVDYDYAGAVKVLQPELEKLFGPVKVFSDYHESRKQAGIWYIEPDGSLGPTGNNDGAAEIVGPPLKLNAAMQAFGNFTSMAKRLKLYTNESTGLHVNISIPKKIDLLKLAVFLGEEYVLKTFGRIDSEYAQSIARALKGEELSDVSLGDEITDFDPAKPKSMARLTQLVRGMMSEHFASINVARAHGVEYLSFRQIGGDYLANADQVMNTIQRFVHVLMIASDPQAYRNEYITKLTKLTGGPKRPEPKSSKQVRSQLTDVMINLRSTGIPVSYAVVAGHNLSGAPYRQRFSKATRNLGSTAHAEDVNDPALLKSIVKNSKVLSHFYNAGMSRDQAKKKLDKLITSPGTRLVVVYPSELSGIQDFNYRIREYESETKSYSPEFDGTLYYMVRTPGVVKPGTALFNHIYKKLAQQ